MQSWSDSGSCQMADCIHTSHTNTPTTPTTPVTPTHLHTNHTSHTSTRDPNSPALLPEHKRLKHREVLALSFCGRPRASPHAAWHFPHLLCRPPARVHSADTAGTLAHACLCPENCSRHLWGQARLPRTVHEHMGTHTQARPFVHSLVPSLLPSIPVAQLLPRATYFRFSHFC